MTRNQIIKLAQEAGIVVTGDAVWKLCELVAAAERESTIKESLPVAEPVAWRQELANILCRIHRDGGHYIAEYGWRKAINDADLKVAHLNAASDAAPPRREWVGLTDEEIASIVKECAQGAAIRRDGTTSQRIARAIEAKLKDKNT